MKTLLLCGLAFIAAGSMQAAIIESISFNLSGLHAGSTLSGTFTLSNSPMSGDTAPVTLTFSDPADYSPTSLMGTIQIGSGTALPYTVNFSVPTFTNLSGALTPINTLQVNLSSLGMAQCAAFPCTATGGLQDNSPAVFTSTYTVTPVPVPEPVYGLLIPFLLIGIAWGRRG